ncbi:uncharacterized protein VNE69_08179 [Vairimorpha necatrix]
MKSKYIKINKTDKGKNKNEDDRAKEFYNLISKWESENVDMKYTVNAFEFTNTKDYKEYHKINVIANRWLNSFAKISTFFLPRLKNEIEKSSFSENVKKSIIEDIKSLYCVMKYYNKLRPKHIRYKYELSTLIFYYKAMIERYPYLFDDFDLYGRFIDLYERIVNQNLEIANSNILNRLLYDMSENLSYILYNPNGLIDNLKGLLTTFERLEPCI